MKHRLLLLCEEARHREALHRAFTRLELEVREMPPSEIEAGPCPGCALAVVHVEGPRIDAAVRRLVAMQSVSKILLLVPFALGGQEMRWVGMGVDDVLTLPVTPARLETTLRNLLRLHALERVAGEG